MEKDYTVVYNLIVESCKIEPEHAKIQEYMKKIQDWHSVLNSSYVHGVLPLVYKTLKKQENFPQEALLAFKTQNMQIAQTNMLMTAELVKIVKLFDENNIKYMAIKGPVLSQLIHGNTLERQYTDLDILVNKEDMPKVGELLYKNNYTSEHDLKFLKNKTLLKIGKDFTFEQKDSHVFVEIHWKLFLDSEIKDSQIKLFSPNTLKCNINNHILATLEIEHLLVYLCLHGSKHLWERIEWVADIDRLVRLNCIDWKKTEKIVKDMKIEVMFYLGLAVAYEMFETPIKNININIYETKKIQKIKDSVFELVFDKDRCTEIDKLNGYKIVHVKNLLTDTKLNNIRSYFLHLFQIKENDIYMVDLPYILSPLYQITRQVNVFKRRYEMIENSKQK